VGPKGSSALVHAISRLLIHGNSIHGNSVEKSDAILAYEEYSSNFFVAPSQV